MQKRNRVRGWNEGQETAFQHGVPPIGSIVLLLAVFGIVVSSLGFLIFTNSIVEEYTGSTYRMADTATALVNGNHLDAYLAGEETAEYEQTRGWLDSYCRSMGVSLIYVIGWTGMITAGLYRFSTL